MLNIVLLIQPLVTYFVFSIIGAYRGLVIQGRNNNFMAPKLENDSPDCLRIRGKHPVWNP